jgi:hypothetical protein
LLRTVRRRQRVPDRDLGCVGVASRFVSGIYVATDDVMPGGDEPALVRCGALTV